MGKSKDNYSIGIDVTTREQLEAIKEAWEKKNRYVKYSRQGIIGQLVENEYERVKKEEL
ncbi:hypothetical protein [Enterococcus faecium]|uniref:Uncharacterized protein n=1 Tax=Enterococcus faecium TaxID=1352 RepID=A0A242BEB2_ENTFC|nr:hypothetical protein [Enterococcus faecium]OTN93659.1 hypothetical protein A5810_001535 [Enterococcus faecium]